jgi:D-psicose/D-tagatose/L-ribulose 3-epimerase
MRFVINTLLFAAPFTTRSTRLFPRFKRMGFDSVEIAIIDPADIDPVRVKRELDRHGLVCGSVCAIIGRDRDLRGTQQQQRTGIAYLRTLIDQMVVLDSPTMIGPVYSAVGRTEAVPAVEQKRQWATVVRNLQSICRYAEKRNRQICMEPLNRFETDFINTCDQALAMIRAVNSPALRLLLDTFHMNIEEKDPAAAIRRAGRHLGHLHACGSDRGTPGNDHTDWESIARALKAIRFDGDVVIESFTKDVEVIAKATCIWRRIEPTQAEIAEKGVRFLKRTLK